MLRTSVLFAFVLSACACSSPSPQRVAQAPADAAISPTAAAALQAAIADPGRSDANRARDAHRHPGETLAFFGVEPGQTVIEITPGGGWYSEILAPYLDAQGRYIGAMPTPAPNSAGERRDAALRAAVAARPTSARATWMNFDPAAPVLGTPASADAVLTFRNVHNWVAAGTAPSYFRAFFAALKPGGVLGVVDHRARPGTDLAKMKTSGYLTEALVIELATEAGFVLEARSEVNANPRDTTDHPNGVWTLPPVNRHAPEDDARYQAIGESDRMTLRFRKPV